MFDLERIASFRAHATDDKRCAATTVRFARCDRTILDAQLLAGHDPGAGMNRNAHAAAAACVLVSFSANAALNPRRVEHNRVVARAALVAEDRHAETATAPEALVAASAPAADNRRPRDANK